MSANCFNAGPGQLGLVTTDVLQTPPVVYLKASVDALFAALPWNFTCVGDPNGQVTAPPGSRCLSTDSGQRWRKQTGTANTGWK